MNAKYVDGRWPRNGTSRRILWQGLQEMLKENVLWGKEEVLGFPSASPHKFGLKAFNLFQCRHTNAILTHTRGHGEKGFDGIKTLERDVIRMVGDLLGSRRVDGYITSGGTEANIMGIWIGREWLRTEIDAPGNQVVLLASPASHYSLQKACALTGIGAGLQFVPSDVCGKISIAALEARIRSLRKKGVRRFIVFLNEGATMTGAMDDTEGVGRLIRKLRKEWGRDVGFYVHVDAAYGGFIYPFLIEYQNTRNAFQVPEVQSVTADPYKMGECPLAQGIFLCRKDLQRYIQRPTGYVQNEYDDTLIGSRSGANAAACYAVFRRKGWVGYHRMHEESVRKAKYLHRKLSKIPWIDVLPRTLNVVAFYLPEDFSQVKLRKMKKEIIEPLKVMWDMFNNDPQNECSHPRRIVKCNITKDVQKKWMDTFVARVAALG